MKKLKLSKTFLDELAKTPNISICCERVGLSRQTIYRWMEEDRKFRKKVNESTLLGVESINDLAESKLIGHIKGGCKRSIEYWLNNHKETYMRPRSKNFWDHIFKLNQATQGGCFIIDFDGDIKYRTAMNSKKEYSINLKENDPVFQDMVDRYDPTIFKIVDCSTKEKYQKAMEEDEMEKKNSEKQEYQ
jgi:hypothetical protein